MNRCVTSLGGTGQGVGYYTNLSSTAKHWLLLLGFWFAVRDYRNTKGFLADLESMTAKPKVAEEESNQKVQKVPIVHCASVKF